MEKIQLDALVMQYRNSMGANIGCSNFVQNQRSYRVSPVLQKYIGQDIQEMLELTDIEPSNSPWAASLLV